MGGLSRLPAMRELSISCQADDLGRGGKMLGGFRQATDRHLGKTGVQLAYELHYK